MNRPITQQAHLNVQDELVLHKVEGDQTLKPTPIQTYTRLNLTQKLILNDIEASFSSCVSNHQALHTPKSHNLCKLCTSPMSLR